LLEPQLCLDSGFYGDRMSNGVQGIEHMTLENGGQCKI
jgi:hypothetical protein